MNKIIKLDINEDDILSGVDAIAFVENPAIEIDFLAFAKESFESFDDYPKAARENARIGIERNEAIGNKCATQVGKVRAQQLAQGKPVSEETIVRMRAFLIRQKDNYELQRDRRNYEACGYISYLLWGGEEALPWAEKKLKQLGYEFNDETTNEAYNVACSDTECEPIQLQDDCGCGCNEDFAEVGPRGGIKASPKAPKSKTKNPNPKGEGSARGSAKTSRGAKVDKATEATLKKKSDDFNEKYKDKLGYGANVGALKSVYQRGLGAYNTSRSPEVASRGGAKQWAMARVNAFLYLLKNGRPQNKKYTTDYDLLPAKHPKAEDMKAIMEAMIFEGIVGEISGVPVYDTKEEAIAKAEEVGCSGYHEHELNGRKVYMPCSQHSDATDAKFDKHKKKKKKYYSDLEQKVRDAIMASLDGVALNQKDIEAQGYVEVEEDVLLDAFNNVKTAQIKSDPTAPSIEDFGDFKVLYRYSTSPLAERDFCVELQKLTKRGKLFRREDINSLSIKGVNEGFGLNGTNFYDIFAYKGGVNCRHRWERVIFKKEGSLKKPLAISEKVTAGTTLNVETAKREEADRLKLDQFSAEMDEKQMVATPIMVPNKLIPRLDENGEKYYVYFTEETIEKIAYKFNKTLRLDNMNYEHDQDSPVRDVALVENWLVSDEDLDKSNIYGYNVPKGTWFGIFKFDNEEFWNEYVKTGKVKGVSAEGFFNNKKG